MRILVLAPQPFFQQRGTPIAVRMLVESLARLGHVIELLVYHEGDPIHIDGVTLHRIPRIPLVRNIPPGPSWKKLPCDFAMLLCAFRLVRKKRIDLIHAVEESAFLAAFLQPLLRVPYVYDMDSSLAEQTAAKWHLPRWLVRILENMENAVIRRSRGVVAVCAALENRARQAAPQHLIQRLEDVSLLQPGPTGPNFREIHAITGPIVMYVGNLERYQGIDLLLDSFALAVTRGTMAHLLLIGGTAGHIAHYEQRAAALRISSRVRFVGPRPLEELHWNLQQADVLVSPRTEGTNTPMKVYSYLDSGRPVLATRLPTHLQVLDDDVALLADPTPESMAGALMEITSDAALRDRLAAQARARVAAEYTPAAFEQKVGAFYGRLMQIAPGLPAGGQGSDEHVSATR